MIVLIDGPEKAGKTTLISELKKRLNAESVSWGPVTGDTVYLQPLKEACASSRWVIWDRGWPSESIYSRLLHRGRRLEKEPFLGEWLYGRAVQTCGLRVILLPGNVDEVINRRDKTDLPVDPVQEYMAYKTYGKLFGYLILENGYTKESLESNIEQIVLRLGTAGIFQPGLYAGPPNAKIVFVGESRSQGRRSVDGSWLPFTSMLTTELGRRLGPSALKFGWTNIDDTPIITLSNRFVIACGERAGAWMDSTGIPRIVIPHPAWMYRFNNAKTASKREIVDRLLTCLGEYNE